MPVRDATTTMVIMIVSKQLLLVTISFIFVISSGECLIRHCESSSRMITFALLHPVKVVQLSALVVICDMILSIPEHVSEHAF